MFCFPLFTLSFSGAVFYVPSLFLATTVLAAYGIAHNDRSVLSCEKERKGEQEKDVLLRGKFAIRFRLQVCYASSRNDLSSQCKRTRNKIQNAVEAARAVLSGPVYAPHAAACTTSAPYRQHAGARTLTRGCVCVCVCVWHDTASAIG